MGRWISNSRTACSIEKISLFLSTIEKTKNWGLPVNSSWVRKVHQ